MPDPTNVNNPERPAYYLTLAEAIALALEHGTTGVQSVRLFGTANDDLLTFTGGTPILGGSDAIRVLALQPAMFGSEIDYSLAKFDAKWTNAVTWNVFDLPSQAVNPAGGANFNSNTSNGQFASFLSAITKPLATGGTAAVLFGAGANPQFGNPFLNSQNSFYQNRTSPVASGTFSQLKQAYEPNLSFQFNQPLFRAFGVDINQLLPRHPAEGTPLDPARPQTNFDLNDQGLLIARLRFDQSRAEFERAVNFMLTNVEFAYWNLYGSYVTLYAREQGMRVAFNIWRISKVQFDAGKISAKDYYPQLAQYEQFRGDRLVALNQVLERERVLRALIGLPVEDCRRLVPIESPTLTPYQPCWKVAVNEALSLRPELVIAREDLKVRQLILLREKNNLLPDVRFTSQYEITGLGNTLTGDGVFPNNQSNNAFRSLASNHFDSWELGLSVAVPIGYRAEYASVRRARLRLMEGFIQVRDQEDRATRFLAQQYRQIFESYAEIEARRNQRLAYGKQLEAKLQDIAVGRSIPDLQLLDALRQWTSALDTEFQAVVAYNNALAGFEFGKGTIQAHDNVHISEGQLPCCAQVRAVEHERERSAALVLRERAQPPAGCCGDKCGLGLPHMPADIAPALPALMKDTVPGAQTPEMLPPAAANQGDLKGSNQTAEPSKPLQAPAFPEAVNTPAMPEAGRRGPLTPTRVRYTKNPESLPPVGSVPASSP